MALSSTEFTAYLDSLFSAYACPEDSSHNGLQVESPKRDLKSVAFAVDARIATFKRAAALHADYLVCHHGLFWRNGLQRAVGTDAERLRLLFQNDISLYAMHLPLDVHPLLGNNAQLANALELPVDCRTSFAPHNGLEIGIVGTLPEPIALSELSRRVSTAVCPSEIKMVGVSSGSDPQIQRVAVITGDGASECAEAAACGAEILVTGEIDHIGTIQALEHGIIVLAAGHYHTETLGIQAVMREAQKHFPQLQCHWIHAPIV